MIGQARDMIDAYEASAAELEPALEKYAAFTDAALRWGFSMLLSRLIRLPRRDNLEACIPFADMLNHSPTAEAFLDWDAASQAVVLQPDRAYSSGEQVGPILADMHPYKSTFEKITRGVGS